MILSIEHISGRLSEVNLSELSDCKFCKSKPEWFNQDQIFVLRCSFCKSVSKGFLCRPCMKEESDIDSAIFKLTSEWNTKNDTK